MKRIAGLLVSIAIGGAVLAGCSPAAPAPKPTPPASTETTGTKLATMTVGKTTVYLDGGKVYDPASFKYAAMDGEPSQVPMFTPEAPEGVKEMQYPKGEPKTFKFLCTSNSVAIPQHYYMFEKNGGTLNKMAASTGYKFTSFFDSGDNKILPNFYIGYFDFAWIPTAIAIENFSGYESRQQELYKTGDNYVIIGAAYNEGDVLYAPADVTSLKQLDGKTVGIMNPNYDMEAAFNAMLQKEGLATESAGGTVKISMAAPAFTLNDLNAQQYAASFARSGYKKALLASGYHELANTDTVFGGRVPATVLVVRKDILEKHPDIVQMVVQANYDATVKGKTDKEWQTKETALVTAFRLEYDGSADRMRTPEVSQLDAQASPEYFKGAYDYMKTYGFFKVPYSLDALVNDSFYQKVKK